ncbi:exocyst complex component EXO70H1-like [Impatiens glandulifera]|uniref:exocyst complex component EXO70H1-like n=1 Tax=Impatiens glandulifera TaxID=253017 RepID=UPI001FB06B88|nr:exocyst complex component EXO70H1-like [Impatiens glandulifera]
MRTAFNSSRSRTPSPPPTHYHHTSSPVRTESPSSSSTPRHFTFSIENLENAKLIITKWDLNASNLYSNDSLFSGNRKEARAFLRSVKDLQTMMHFLASEASKSELLIQSQNLIQIAMKRLENEFYQILSKNRNVLDPESVSNRLSRMSIVSSLEDELDESDDEEAQVTGGSVSEEVEKSTTTTENAMSDLRLIANCMTSTGYTKECVKIYKIVRKSIVDETLYELGVEKLNLSQVQKMDWDTIEVKIKSWLKAVKYSVKTLFNGERILSDNVFSSPPRIAESCFTDNCKDGALTLFIFPELISKYKKLSPEKIFRLLDMYDSIFDLWPEINTIFSQESVSVVKSQCETSLSRLRESIRSMLTEFEAAVQKDATKSPVANGGVHPLTSYVMNYLVFLSDYSGSLTEIVSDWQQSAQSPMPTTYISSLSPASDQVSSVSLRLGWIILVLFCKLDSKAELFKDASLSYLYLANNINYVVSKVKSTYLKLLLGDVWISKHEEKVKLYMANYERIGWGKVFSAMEEIKQMAGNSPDCFRGFNSAFEETYRKQVEWVVPDRKLRDAVKLSLAQKLVPAYRELYEKKRGAGAGAGDEVIIRYAPVDLGNYLSDLFFGSGVMGSTSSSSVSREGRRH